MALTVSALHIGDILMDWSLLLSSNDRKYLIRRRQLWPIEFI